MKKLLIAGALVLTLMSGALRPSYAILDKTRFATDLGVAFFAFHRWVYSPFRSGAFAQGAPSRGKALVKGGLALLFAATRVRAANNIAQHSKSPLLHALAGRINAMSGAFASVGQRLRSGRYNGSDISSLNGIVSQVGSGAAAAGTPIRDIAVPIPGT